MKRRLIIKTRKLRGLSKNKQTKIIVVGFNTSTPNGRYIEKLGTITKYGDSIVVVLKLWRFAIWFNKGAKINSRVSSYIGKLAQADKKKINIDGSDVQSVVSRMRARYRNEVDLKKNGI